ncbi:MAG: DUF3684 domain-containing protein, partial [Planctomycetes bacterium]|nr:DUF3684 domain-containing protein [Planctomycetota bacterium]
RKDVVLDLDFKSEWNRMAIATAAQTFANNIVSVRDTIGAVRFWQVIMSLESVSREVGKQERDGVFARFWEIVQPELRANPVVLTSQNSWARPDEVTLLEKKEELASLPILEALGVHIAHSDLRFTHGLLTAATVGVRLFGAIDLATALQGAGLTSRHERSDLPEFLRTDAQWNEVWDECDRLLEQLSRKSPGQRDAVRRELAKCSVAPCRDGAFWPCNAIYQADESTAGLFARTIPELQFVDQGQASFTPLQSLCPELDAAAAVYELGQVDATQLRAALEADSSLACDLLGWFQDRRAQFRQNDGLRSALKHLPIFPASTGFEPLSQLALPGGFDDPLKIAGIISIDALVGRLDFLNDLGAAKLTFETYARTRIPDAVVRDDLPVESRRELIQLLARKGSELRDFANICSVLADLPIVECADDYFRSANDVYFDTAPIREVLGEVPLAALPTEHTEGVRAFYLWLGVADEPRLDAVIRRITEVTANPPTDDAVATIQRLFEHLATRVGTIELGTPAASLRTAAWLAAQGEASRWFRPDEVYAVFRKSLFESQASFLDVPLRVQQQSTKFLECLGVRANPSNQQVIAHLLHRSANNEPVAENIYQYLADEAQPQSLLRLRDEACIHLGDGKFVRPDQVFWQPHPFGRYRWQLGDSLRKYHELFTRLGVNESASSRDAIQVLYEIEHEFGVGNHALDPDAKLVVAGCWRRLTTAIQIGEFASEELAPLETRKLICSPNGVLQPPQWMFFEDRPNLAAKFGRFLDNNAIKQPEGMGQAMQAAGVRFLSQAVQAHIVEKEGSVESTEVLDRIRDRWDLLHRFLEFENPAIASKLDVLLEVRCVRLTRLLIVQTLKVFNRELQSNPELAQAYLSREEGELHYVAADGRVPWIAISRELVGLLSPDEQPGQLAIGMKDVLGGDSHDLAKSVLDELQIPEIDRQSMSGQPAPGVISSLGEHVDDSGANDNDFNIADEVAAETQEVEESAAGGDPNPAEATTAEPTRASPTGSGNGDGRGKAPSGGTGARPGPGAGVGTKTNGSDADDPDSEDFNSPPDGRSPGAKRDRRGPGKRKGYAVLRSYVMPDRAEDDEVITDCDGHARRTEIAQAGVSRVMQFEHEEGRHPREMPPLHKGNDIESDDADGNIERVIEVKSIPGEWLGAEAGLTKPQVERARQLRHQYWLYVVENALDDDHYRIHRIRDPYGQANRFMFDPGWCQVEEHGTASDARLDALPDSSDGDSAPTGEETDASPID